MCIHVPHTALARVGDQEAAARQHGQPRRFVEQRPPGEAAVASTSAQKAARYPAAGDNADDAARIHTADPVAVPFGDQEPAAREHRFDPARFCSYSYGYTYLLLRCPT
jgi:hypothetical protein